METISVLIKMESYLFAERARQDLMLARLYWQHSYISLVIEQEDALVLALPCIIQATAVLGGPLSQGFLVAQMGSTWQPTPPDPTPANRIL